MKSFSQSLQITKNFKLLEQAFNLMAQKGIDPQRFVDWYVEEGVIYQESGSFEEGFWQNLSNRWGKGMQTGSANQSPNRGAESAGRYLGGAVQGIADKFLRGTTAAKNAWQGFNNALGGEEHAAARSAERSAAPKPNMPGEHMMVLSALNNLSKRMGLSKSLNDKIGDPNFSNNLLNLIGMLKGEVKENTYYNNIRTSLVELQSMGVDIEALAEWYFYEIQNINEGPVNWLSRAGNWLGNQWANIKHSVGNWGRGGAIRDSQLDQKAIDNVLNALKQMPSNGDGEFQKVLSAVYEKLKSLNSNVHGDQAVYKPSPGTGSDDVKGSGQSREYRVNPGEKAIFRGRKGQFASPPSPPRDLGPDGPQYVGNNNSNLTGVYGDATQNDEEELSEDFIKSITPKNGKFSWFG
jgi:hypothetical protein